MTFAPGPVLSLEDPVVAAIVGRGVELAEAEILRDGGRLPTGLAGETLRRVKAFGRARVVEGRPQLAGRPTSTRAEDVGVTEAARILGLSTERVRALYDEGRLPGSRDGDGPRRFRVEDVEALADRRARGAQTHG